MEVAEALALRDLITLSADVYKMRAAATGYIPYCFEKNDLDGVLSLLRLLSYKDPVIAAIAASDAAHDLWPLLERMASAPDLEQEVVTLSCVTLRKDAGSPEYIRKFSRLAQLSPACAARVGEALCREAPAPIAGLADTLVELALYPDERVASRARTSLRMGAEHGVPLGSLARLEAALAHASDAVREDLVALLCRSLINDLGKTKRVEALQTKLADPRAEVRRGVIQALRSASRKRATLWPLLLGAANDPSASVRKLVLETAKIRAEEHPKWLPTDKQVRSLLTGVTDASSNDVHDYLSVIAAKAPTLAAGWLELLEGLPNTGATSALRRAILRQAERRPSRACALCRTLGKGDTWNNDLRAPKAFANLEVPNDGKSGGLWRCGECAAYFEYSYDCEYDVNSKHESMTLVRLTKREAVSKYLDRIDATHPRWAAWETALVEDLDHLDTAVRAAAAWELAKDACAENAFARVEALLHHPAPEVIAEALLGLVATCATAPCPVARETLTLLSRHTEPVVQRHAAYLLVVQSASDRSRPLEWIFEDGAACEGQASAVSRLIAEGMTLATTAAVPLLRSALRVGSAGRYTIHSLLTDAVLSGAQGERCGEMILDALLSADVATRTNAFALAQRLPDPLRGTAAGLRRAIDAQRLEPTLAPQLAMSMVQAGAPLAIAEALVARALADRERNVNQSAVLAIDAALARGESCMGLFAPLCELCDRVRDAYGAMALVRKWATAQAVPPDCLPILRRIVDTGIGSFHDDCVHAVMSMHLRANDEPAVLLLLQHRLASVRGIAATHLGEARTIASEVVLKQLAQMVAGDEAYPRAHATRALAVLAP